MLPHRNPNWHWSCGICTKDHPLKSCERFLKSSPFQRFQTVLNKHYCQNCLARSHLISDCLSKLVCRECFRRHHTLLHGAPQLATIPEKIPNLKLQGKLSRHHSTSFNSIPKAEQKQTIKPEQVTAQEQSKSFPKSTKKPDITTPKIPPIAVETKQFVWTKVFVPTATVKITHNKMEIWYPVRAAINESLSISRISKSCVQKLVLPTKKISGFQFAKFQIKSRMENSRWIREIKALVTEELPKSPYSGRMKKDPTTDFTDNLLADVDPMSNTPIDIELGSDLYPDIRRDGALDSALNKVIAVKTALGYVFSGPAEDLDLA